jgi:hypothetical protein
MYVVSDGAGNVAASGSLEDGSYESTMWAVTHYVCYNLTLTSGSHACEISWDLADSTLTGGAPGIWEFYATPDGVLHLGCANAPSFHPTTSAQPTPKPSLTPIPTTENVVEFTMSDLYGDGWWVESIRVCRCSCVWCQI